MTTDEPKNLSASHGGPPRNASPDHPVPGPDASREGLAGVDWETLRRTLRLEGVSDDAIAGAALRLLQRRAGPPVENLAGYLRVAARRAEADLHRVERRQRQATAEVGSSREPDPEQTPDRIAALGEERVRMLRALAERLTPEEAWLVTQHYHRRKTIRNLAAEIGLSPEGARKRLLAALEKLRRTLAQDSPGGRPLD